MSESVSVMDKPKEQFLTCRFKKVDGHLEADCPSKEVARELAELLEHEVIIRVRPAKVTQESLLADG